MPHLSQKSRENAHLVVTSSSPIKNEDDDAISSMYNTNAAYVVQSIYHSPPMVLGDGTHSRDSTARISYNPTSLQSIENKLIKYTEAQNMRDIKPI